MGKIDVFICFEGGESLGQGLYDAFKEAHINAVTADKSLNKEQNQLVAKFHRKAIKKAKIFVIVFSQNFASCSACLNELVHILKELKDGQTIVPVFDHVDPSDIRKQRGDYQIGSDQVEAIEALKRVTSIKGVDSRNFGSNKELLTKVIVDYVKQKLCSIKKMKWQQRGLAVGLVAVAGAALPL